MDIVCIHQMKLPVRSLRSMSTKENECHTIHKWTQIPNLDGLQVACTYVCFRGVLADHVCMYVCMYACSPAYQSFIVPSALHTFGSLICTDVLDGVTLALIVATVLDLKGAQTQTHMRNSDYM